MSELEIGREREQIKNELLARYKAYQEAQASGQLELAEQIAEEYDKLWTETLFSTSGQELSSGDAQLKYIADQLTKRHIRKLKK